MRCENEVMQEVKDKFLFLAWETEWILLCLPKLRIPENTQVWCERFIQSTFSEDLWLCVGHSGYGSVSQKDTHMVLAFKWRNEFGFEHKEFKTFRGHPSSNGKRISWEAKYKYRGIGPRECYWGHSGYETTQGGILVIYWCTANDSQTLKLKISIYCSTVSTPDKA